MMRCRSSYLRANQGFYMQTILIVQKRKDGVVEEEEERRKGRRPGGQGGDGRGWTVTTVVIKGRQRRQEVAKRRGRGEGPTARFYREPNQTPAQGTLGAPLRPVLTSHAHCAQVQRRWAGTLAPDT